MPATDNHSERVSEVHDRLALVAGIIAATLLLLAVMLYLIDPYPKYPGFWWLAVLGLGSASFSAILAAFISSRELRLVLLTIAALGAGAMAAEGLPLIVTMLALVAIGRILAVGRARDILIPTGSAALGVALIIPWFTQVAWLAWPLSAYSAWAGAEMRKGNRRSLGSWLIGFSAVAFLQPFILLSLAFLLG